MNSKFIAVVAGEPSGDWIAANAIGQLLKIDGDIRVFGIGGDHLAAQGVNLVKHISSMTALGPMQSLKRGPAWMAAWGDFRIRCRKQKPAAALLVDCPDINLPLARALKADGIRVLQYMGPKVWAWRKDRLRLLRRRTDLVALGFAFEKEIYDKEQVSAVFVGHPLLDAPVAGNRDEVRRKLHAPPGARVVALLPGSRKSELEHHTSPMIEAGARLLKDGFVPVFAPFAGVSSDAYLATARSLGCVVWSGPVGELFAGCDGALAASGTVTLELALAGVPMAIVYRMDRVGYWMGKRLLDIPYVGLPNWVAGEAVVPELLQEEVTAARLYQMAHHLVVAEERQRQQHALRMVSEKLGTPGAAYRVARILNDWIP